MSMENRTAQKKGITGSTLKITACALMLIDHIGAVFLEGFLRTKMTSAVMDLEQQQDFLSRYGTIYYLDLAMRLMGRLAFPIFCFLLLEGFSHTRNVKKYAFNLGLFALISEIPFNLAFTTALGGHLQYGLFYPGYQNVFFTLFLSLLTLCGYRYLKEHRGCYTTGRGGKLLAVLAGILGDAFVSYFIAKNFGNYLAVFDAAEQWMVWLLTAIFFVLILLMVGIYAKKHGGAAALNLSCDLAVLALGIWAAEFLKTDYAGTGILTVAAMYYFRENKEKSMAWGCAVLTIFNPMEVTAFLALLPVKRYNGERGLKMKYFFYVFYPAHLLILYLISRLVMG